MHMISVKGADIQSATYFRAEGFCWSRGAVITVMDYSVLKAITRTGLMKSAPKRPI